MSGDKGNFADRAMISRQVAKLMEQMETLGHTGRTELGERLHGGIEMLLWARDGDRGAHSGEMTVMKQHKARISAKKASAPGMNLGEEAPAQDQVRGLKPTPITPPLPEIKQAVPDMIRGLKPVPVIPGQPVAVHDKTPINTHPHIRGLKPVQVSQLQAHQAQAHPNLAAAAAPAAPESVPPAPPPSGGQGPDLAGPTHVQAPPPQPPQPPAQEPQGLISEEDLKPTELPQEASGEAPQRG